jgi:hypothetical protein
MTQQEKEHDSVCNQVETILKNRFRRFKHLMKNDRVEDAVAIGEEFTEWMLETDEIIYFSLNDLKELLESK